MGRGAYDLDSLVVGVSNVDEERRQNDRDERGDCWNPEEPLVLLSLAREKEERVGENHF